MQACFGVLVGSFLFEKQKTGRIRQVDDGNNGFQQPFMTEPSKTAGLKVYGKLVP